MFFFYKYQSWNIYLYFLYISFIGGSIVSLFYRFSYSIERHSNESGKLKKEKKERRQEGNRTEAWLFKADVIEIGNRIFFPLILFFFILLSRVSVYLNPSSYTENITVHDCIEHKINMKYSLTSGILNKMQIEI